VTLARGIASYSPSPSHNFSTLGPIGRTVSRVEAPQGAPSQAEKSTLPPDFAEYRSARCRLIAGESNVSLVCSAGGCAGAAGDRNRRDGVAPMTIANNDGRLQGPADAKRIDVSSPAEMRHWVREIGRPAAKLNEAVKVVGPLVSDVRDYLRTRSLYGRPR
jgi:Protein of unknown function (DUF3606)